MQIGRGRLKSKVTSITNFLVATSRSYKSLAISQLATDLCNRSQLTHTRCWSLRPSVSNKTPQTRLFQSIHQSPPHVICRSGNGTHLYTHTHTGILSRFNSTRYNPNPNPNPPTHRPSIKSRHHNSLRGRGGQKICKNHLHRQLHFLQGKGNPSLQRPVSSTLKVTGIGTWPPFLALVGCARQISGFWQSSWQTCTFLALVGSWRTKVSSAQ